VQEAVEVITVPGSVLEQTVASRPRTRVNWHQDIPDTQPLPAVQEQEAPVAASATQLVLQTVQADEKPVTSLRVLAGAAPTGGAPLTEYLSKVVPERCLVEVRWWREVGA
jgi:hypothetical protein